MKIWLLWIFFLSSFNCFCMDDSCFYFVTLRLCKSIVINLLGFLLLSGWLFCLRGMQDLSSLPGIKPVSPAVKCSFNHWTARKFLACLLTKQKPYLEEVKKNPTTKTTLLCHSNGFYTHPTSHTPCIPETILQLMVIGWKDFPGDSGVRNLTLWHNFAAWCYWLKSWIAMRTKRNLLGCCHFGGVFVPMKMAKNKM